MTKNNTTTDVLISSFLQRLSNYDADGVADLFADEIDWYVPGDTALPWVGQRSHQADVAAYFRTMWPHFQKGRSIVTPGSMVMSGNEVVLFANFQHTVVRTGKSFQTPVAFHLIIAEGKIIKLHLYEDTWTVSRAFID